MDRGSVPVVLLPARSRWSRAHRPTRECDIGGRSRAEILCVDGGAFSVIFYGHLTHCHTGENRGRAIPHRHAQYHPFFPSRIANRVETARSRPSRRVTPRENRSSMPQLRLLNRQAHWVSRSEPRTQVVREQLRCRVPRPADPGCGRRPLEPSCHKHLPFLGLLDPSRRHCVSHDPTSRNRSGRAGARSYG